MRSASLTRFRTRRAFLAGFLLVVALVANGCSSNRGSTYIFDWNLLWQSIFTPDGFIINGLYLTIVISIVSQVLGVILGIFAALGRMSRVIVFRVIANFYIWFFRGTPLLVQLVFFFYGFKIAHVLDWPSFEGGFVNLSQEVLAGMIILGINEGAYMAEIVRAGILAIDAGQTEAAKSLGMTYSQTMRRIVLPQAARVIIPPLGNEFNNMIKNTSLLFVLSVFELFNTFDSNATATFKYFEYMLAACFWYLLLTTIWGVVQAWIERRFAKGTLTQNEPGWRDRFFGFGRRDEIGVLGGH